MGNVPSSPPATVFYTAWASKLPQMKNKVVAITGCTSGTGLVLAQTCGQLGAKVVMLNRPSERANAALAKLHEAKSDAVLVPIDLQSFASVGQAAEELTLHFPEGIDVLCNNAGVMATLDVATADGFDVQMQSNHLSHFLLTSAIWPLLLKAAELRGEARVVNHSSSARKAPGKPIVEEKFYRKNGGNLGGDGFPGLGKWNRYKQSKLANLMFTYALHDKAAEQQDPLAKKVKILCAHPGPTSTGLQLKTAANGGTRYLDQYILNQALRNGQSSEDGAMGITLCCCARDVESLQFYGPSTPGQPGEAVLLPAERNAENEQTLWDESLKATSLSSFFPPRLAA
ncbi:putative oxidoreductase [Diplonema papillatum]|nr:putative oxidoreductase [Diplonema papillatum]